MNEHDLIANLLRGAEKQQSDLKSACTGMAEIIGNLVDAFKAQGFDIEQSMFLAVKAFEIFLKQARNETEGENG